MSLRDTIRDLDELAALHESLEHARLDIPRAEARHQELLRANPLLPEPEVRFPHLGLLYLIPWVGIGIGVVVTGVGIKGGNGPTGIGFAMGAAWPILIPVSFIITSSSYDDDWARSIFSGVLFGGLSGVLVLILVVLARYWGPREQLKSAIKANRPIRGRILQSEASVQKARQEARDFEHRIADLRARTEKEMDAQA